MEVACKKYKYISQHAKIICTVSEYSKKQISSFYHVPAERIHVIYSGSIFMKNTKPDNSIFNTFPILNKSPFYFTLGSLSKRKNIKWIFEHAQLFPDELFVITGKSLLSGLPTELDKIKCQKNILLTGYLSDGQVKALMTRCKAFIFPSYFEGFGMPPLEALSCGAKIIISNKTSLPEIYGQTACYIDPYKPDVNLDELLLNASNSPEQLFEKYSSGRAAEKLYNLICTQD
jgi:glycosyltransferase involved in cell wall biosynthesis